MAETGGFVTDFLGRPSHFGSVERASAVEFIPGLRILPMNLVLRTHSKPFIEDLDVTAKACLSGGLELVHANSAESQFIRDLLEG